MASPLTHHMFRSFTYQKTIAEVVLKMEKKVEFLRAKITEREARIVKIRQDYDITDLDLINLLSQAANEARSARNAAPMSYSLEVNGANEAPRYIAAGVVENLVTERSLIEQEKKSVDQIQLIARNLTPLNLFGDNGEPYTTNHVTLSHDELEYLGF